MNNLKYISILIFLLAMTLSSCQQKYQPGQGISLVPEAKTALSEIDALLQFVANSGDYINSNAVPSLVPAEDVSENINKYYIIDIRTKKEYVAGHINGAVNVEVPALMTYLEKSVAASVYDKLVVVCANGQSSAYVAGVLRMIGYSNAFSMSYGMSAWNPSLDQWSSRISSKYSHRLEQKENAVTKTYLYPAIKTGETCGAEILNARGKTLLNTPIDRLKIKADRLFGELDEFYIIAYMTKEMYDVAHIPGAHHYEPKQAFTKEALLNTLPSNNKKILVYDYTGQTSAFVVAYLRLLGYNAFLMPLGANSFMYNTLKSNGKPIFTKSNKVNDFALVKGENPTDKEFEKQIQSSRPAPAKAKTVIKRKKKEVEGGCS